MRNYRILVLILTIAISVIAGVFLVIYTAKNKDDRLAKCVERVQSTDLPDVEKYSLREICWMKYAE